MPVLHAPSSVPRVLDPLAPGDSSGRAVLLALLRRGIVLHAPIVAVAVVWLLFSSPAPVWMRALEAGAVAGGFALACVSVAAIAYCFVLSGVRPLLRVHEALRTDRSEEPLPRRRLTAIAFLDVVGYSRLIGVDEEATLREWEALRRAVIEPRVGLWRGRVVNRAGDGILVEFRCALDAFRWAVDVQDAIASRVHAGAPMQVRIAAHLGDVIAYADGEVEGEGVNIAARLQAYAEPGGVIVSRAMADEILRRTDTAFADLGELRLRNIGRPVHAFRLRGAEVPPFPKPSRPFAGGIVPGPTGADA